ncbi:MarC family protein [Campylobacter sp. MIT 12-5580]|uniref:MarC family protein n=1 Tax=Campylobacter sp. MIT 12-5580 TaxID=2040651 RepID=UPI0010F4E539|nr:MarC family protein [Campylobacter sp. MIT 12-5580]TKX30353.1 MarC family protein [Campylobacter sp. MIT 12-5580]
MFASVESQIYSMFLISITILAVLNPFGNLTQFLTMTGELATPIRQKLFRNILYTAFIIVMVFLLTGSFIMRYVFSVSLDDLRIAGGLILIIMAIKNLLFVAKKQELLHYQGLDEKDLLAASVVPMAFPMLVGPGTLSTAIVASEDSGLLIACGAVVFAFAFMFLLFHFAATIERIIGKLILHVFSRIAQVFIMAIGIKMMIIGIKDIFHL